MGSRHRNWVALFSAAFVALCLAACGGGSGGLSVDASDDPNSASQRNVLLVIADDFGLDLASFSSTNPCYNVGDISNDPSMPNISALCQNGVKFTNAWAMPICSPTRATILTGTFPWQHGVTHTVGSSAALPADSWTLPAALVAASDDYAVGSFGKWHVSRTDSDPNTFGWQRYAGDLNGGVRTYNDWDRTVDGQTQGSNAYVTSQNVDDAIAWHSSLARDKTWLMWMAFNAPHAPYHAPDSDLHAQGSLDPYQDGDDAAPYGAAMSEALDTELGRLVTHLQTSGDWNNTVVIFIGDNGTAAALKDTGAYVGRKGTLNEGGVNVPFVVAGPGISARTEHTPVSVADLFATIIQYMGQDPESLRQTQANDVTLDGEGLMACINDARSCDTSRYIYARVKQTSGNSNDGYAIRDQQHKLICYDDGNKELFDLNADGEGTDLYSASDSRYITLRDQLRQKTGDNSVCADLPLAP